jgi:hypothetical protein
MSAILSDGGEPKMQMNDQDRASGTRATNTVGVDAGLATEARGNALARLTNQRNAHATVTATAIVTVTRTAATETVAEIATVSEGDGVLTRRGARGDTSIAMTTTTMLPLASERRGVAAAL